uniref:Protein ARV n=1 Tax=Salmo trutta TaxID=8032 RepID=A0A674EGW9_SALTR
MANGFFRCFECNKDAHELRKDYSNGILKITICESFQRPKLCVVCLLCESYLRWSQIQGSEQNNDPADIIRYTNEWECLEWQLLVYCSWKNLMLKAILLSSYGNILLIPIVIWEHDYSPLCFSFIMLFVLTRRLSLLAVCVGLLLETCIAQAFQTLPWSIQDILPFQ